MISWQRVNIVDLLNQKMLEIGDGYRAKNSELARQGVPFARAGNVSEGFDFSGADFFPESNLYKVGSKISKVGDVVFTSKGTVGRFAFVNEFTQKFVYSPQLCYWRSLRYDIIDPQWLYYWMQSPEFFSQYKGVSGQTDMAEYVSLRDQKKMHITLPSLDEQKDISFILSFLDHKIELNKNQNETLEAIVQALFKSWFVDFDPVKAKSEGRKPEGMDDAIATLFPSRFTDSQLGLIPEGWELKGLDEIATFLNGLALQKYPALDPENYLPVIKISQLRSGDIAGADKASTDVPPDYIIRDGDILFSWSGSLEVEIWCGGRGALNQHLFKVSSKDFPKWFYFLWTRQHLDNFQKIAESKATTMGHIQRKHLSEAKVICPPVSVIQGVNEIMEPMLEKFVQVKLEDRNLAYLRDTLLPRLISGKLRVDEVNETVEALAL